MPNPVTYPFKSISGEQTINQQQSGNRIYDINADGVAHYGLYPDWIEDLRQLAGKEIIKDMANGAEAYLQMWERAEGVTRVRCPVWRGQFNSRGLDKTLRVGESAEQTLYRAGQPVERDRVWRWCTRFEKDGKRELGKRRQVSGVFDTEGTLQVALSTLAKNSPAARTGMRPASCAAMPAGSAAVSGSMTAPRAATSTSTALAASGSATPASPTARSPAATRPCAVTSVAPACASPAPSLLVAAGSAFANRVAADRHPTEGEE